MRDTVRDAEAAGRRKGAENERDKERQKYSERQRQRQRQRERQIDRKVEGGRDIWERQLFERQYTVNGDKLLKTRAIDDILKLGEAGESSDHKMTRGFNPKKPNRTADLVAAIEDDRHIWVKPLATVHDASAGTIFDIIGSNAAVTGPDGQQGGDLRGLP